MTTAASAPFASSADALQAARAAARRGDLDAAIAAWRQAQAGGRMELSDWLGLGDALDARGRAADAYAAYRSAAALDKGSASARLGLGNALSALGRGPEALVEYERGLKLDPAFPALWANYAVALSAADRPEAAIAAYDRALALAPRLVPALVGRGNAKAMLNRHDEALPDFEAAVAVAPSSPHARFNRGLALLRRGDWTQGLADYEARWAMTGRDGRRPGLWLGQDDIAGHTLLVDAEQGFGDSLMFARFLPLVADRAGRTIVRAPRALTALLAGVDPRLEVIAGEDHPSFAADRYVPMASLPLACGATPESVPAPPYLKADPDAVAAWRRRLGPSRRRIGIVWAGGPARGAVRGRGLPLKALLRALAGAGDIVCLQKDVDRADRALLAKAGAAVFSDELTDFAATAALACACDEVVSIDTSVAHLVGGLGLNLTVLLPFFSDWRWSAAWSPNPWYLQARLARQPARGDWDGALAALAAD
ncbi:hypothetical protein AS593_15605 [Caulobacter vibrioides]|nr:hypothetical protein AS593_15605 [Caulobacter vibrioides]